MAKGVKTPPLTCVAIYQIPKGIISSSLTFINEKQQREATLDLINVIAFTKT